MPVSFTILADSWYHQNPGMCHKQHDRQEQAADESAEFSQNFSRQRSPCGGHLFAEVGHSQVQAQCSRLNLADILCKNCDHLSRGPLLKEGNGVAQVVKLCFDLFVQ